MELIDAERAARDAASARDAALAAAERRQGGIVHTPPELARFVARAADDALREHLGLPGGLADPAAALIDPACGPGAFFAAALAVAGGRGTVPAALVGLDRDPAAVRAARAVLVPECTRHGWPCALEVRDTLREARPEALSRLGRVPVVLGNPPWITRAQARPAPWLDGLLDEFRREPDGAPLNERKLGVLADAYVRFAAWACEVARRGEGGGVLALVTNASYLDGPVHRGMRAALRRSFDALYVVDLGGNALLARTSARDDNVFGVRPAVAVLIAVRTAGERARSATLRYARVTGPLACKLGQLARGRLGDETWLRALPPSASDRFVPVTAACADYAAWPSLAEAMPFHREGVQTNRDAVAVDRARERLLERLHDFAAGRRTAELEVAFQRLAHYEPEVARRAVAQALEADPEGQGGAVVAPIAYRPLDARWFTPIAPLCHRPRPQLLAALAHSRFALISARKDRGSLAWAHFGAARGAIDNCWLSTRSSCRARAFPTHDPEGRENLALRIAARFGERAGRAIGAPEFACYALAVLASPEYRARHDEALRADYPRIPPPRDGAQFEALCSAGARLVELLCAPLPSPLPGLATGELRRQEARAELRIGAASACAPESALLRFTIGHHRVLRELLRSAGELAGDPAWLHAACDRVRELERCIAGLEPPG